jgi:hypothetical protein
MYGFNSKQEAIVRADKLRVTEPNNRFTVEPHSWLPGFNARLSDGSINELAARTWGVVRYEPYCEVMPWRCTGFVWFEGERVK